MAFVRSYSRAMSDVGDPFSLRIPKKLRKLKVGRALGKVARAGISFVPGVGGIAGALLGRLQKIAAKYNIDPQVLAGFARSYGYDPEGDVGDPSTTKRKAAGSGTKNKAAAKQRRRAQKQAHPKPRRKAPGGGESFGHAVGRHAADAAAGVGEVIGKYKSGDIAGAVTELLKGGKASPTSAQLRLPGMGGGGHHRSINPANVKALRRSIRRLDSFGRLVKSVRKAARGLKGELVHGGTTHGHARARGHKSGCGCAVCRRAA